MEPESTAPAPHAAGPNYMLIGLLAVAVVVVIGVYGYQRLSSAGMPSQNDAGNTQQTADASNQTTPVTTATLQGTANPLSGAPTASPLQTTVNPFATATTSAYTNPFNTQ